MKNILSWPICMFLWFIWPYFRIIFICHTSLITSKMAYSWHTHQNPRSQASNIVTSQHQKWFLQWKFWSEFVLWCVSKVLGCTLLKYGVQRLVRWSGMAEHSESWLLNFGSARAASAMCGDDSWRLKAIVDDLELVIQGLHLLWMTAIWPFWPYEAYSRMLKGSGMSSDKPHR